MSKSVNNPFYELNDESTNDSFRDHHNNNPYSTQKDLTSKFLKSLGTIRPIVSIEPQTNAFLDQGSLMRTRLKNANQRLKEFQQLVSKTGLFNDQDSKLNNLLLNIKQDLDWTHKTLEELQKSSRQMNELQKSIVDLLQTQAIQLSNVFKKVLEQHTERVRVLEEKRNKFEGGRDRLIRRGQASQKLFLNDDTKEGSDQEQLQQGNQNNHSVIQMQGNQLNQHKVSQMKRIEGMLNDVGQVFQRLGTMVRMQETMIDRIDKYTEESVFNVDRGRKELQTAYQRASNNRGLILKIFLILFIFSFIYIVFVV